MTARTFDPFAVDRPVLKLGEHGQWVLADITDARKTKLDALQTAMSEISGKTDATVADVAAVVGDLCEAACLDAEGLSALLVDLTDDAKHGNDTLGAGGLRSIAEFVKSHLLGEADAGEG